jgi:RNA polymerase sigma factor (sigma-70 family)
MARPGDRDGAFASFYDAHYDTVRRFAERHFGEAEADDIAQETMLRALAGFDALDAERSARPWLMTVARNVGIDRLRRNRSVTVDRYELERMAGAVDDATDQVSMRVDVGDVLDRAMRRMSAGDRRVLVLREVCGFDARDIAARLGMSHAAIRQRMVRARRSLTHHYAELGGRQYAVLVAARDAVARPARHVARAVSRQGVPFDGTAERVVAGVAAVAMAATLGGAGRAPEGVPAPLPAEATAPASLRPPGTLPVAVTDLAPPWAGALPASAVTTAGAFARPAVSFAEDWEAAGLPGWRRTGTAADRTCDTSVSGRCSLRVAPKGEVTLTRPVDVALTPTTVLTAYVNVPAGTGGAHLALRMTFDTGETLTATVEPTADTRFALTSSGSDERVELALASPGAWRPVVVAVDGAARRATLSSVWAAPLGGVALRTVPRRIVALAVTGGTDGAGTAFGLDTVTVAAAPQCMDGVDNDDDGHADLADGACHSRFGTAEAADPTCSDGLDNDDDGFVDYPQDPGCYFRDGQSEAPQCSDGADNDGDDRADFPDDPDCASLTDPTEVPQCSDGLDNDKDGAADFPAEKGCGAPGDDSEQDCAAVRSSAGTTRMIGPDEVFGVCLDALTEIARVGVVARRPAARVLGHVGTYVFGTARVTCVALTGDVPFDPCGAAGGTLVERDGWLVRADAEGLPEGTATGAGLCTATLAVLACGDVEPPQRRDTVLTLC